MSLLRHTSCSWAVITATMFIVPAGDANAQVNVIVSESFCGSMKTDLGYGIAVNKYSTMNRRCLTVNSDGCPARLSDVGIVPKYDSDDRGYKYDPLGSLIPLIPIQAFEVRFILYDLWGEHLQTLSLTQVQDLKDSVSFDLSIGGQWRTWEQDVTKFGLSVGYIARVMTKDGKVWTADSKRVIESLLTSSVAIKPEELNPAKMEKK